MTNMTTGPHGRMTPDLYGEYFVQFLVSTLLEAVMDTNSSIEDVSQRPRTWLKLPIDLNKSYDSKYKFYNTKSWKKV